MRINIKLFAVVRDRAGVSELVIDLPENSTAGDLSNELAKKFPLLDGILKRVAFAVNQSYVPATTRLQDGDELAIIPPVSGG